MEQSTVQVEKGTLLPLSSLKPVVEHGTVEAVHRARPAPKQQSRNHRTSVDVREISENRNVVPSPQALPTANPAEDAGSKSFSSDGQLHRYGREPPAPSEDTWWSWLSGGATSSSDHAIAAHQHGDCTVGGAIVSADGEAAVEAPADAPDCPICYDRISPGDAAMRCVGSNGVKHFFHKQCLGTWVHTCMENGSTPTCPVCRGSVLVNVAKLDAFLQSSQASQLRAEEISSLQMLLARARATLGTASEDEAWAEPFSADDAAYAGIISACATAGFFAAYSDGPESIVGDMGLLLAPTPTAQGAAVAGYVTGHIVRGVQALVEHGAI